MADDERSAGIDRFASRPRVVDALRRAGCVAAEEEADELCRVAASSTELEAMLERRCGGEPIAWIVGSVDFLGSRVRVARGVFVPRWQSEALARRALELAPRGGLLVDLCTGAGAVAVCLERTPGARVVASELDPLAAACARDNGVEVYEGDLDAPLPDGIARRAHLVTAVPPYVPSDAIATLPSDARDFEPLLALDGGEDGCHVLRRVLEAGARLLRPGGALVVELGGDEADRLRDDLARLGYTSVRVHFDEDGDARFLEAIIEGRPRD